MSQSPIKFHEITLSGGEKTPQDILNLLKSSLTTLQAPEETNIPMTKEEALEIFLSPEVRWQPKLGDLVTIRPNMSCQYKIPEDNQVCVVTQVLSEAVREDVDTPDGAKSLNMSLGFRSSHGSHQHYFEGLFDSRYFTRVGNIYDGTE